MKNKYENMIHLPHKQSATRPHMSVADRAAQFAPFAALVGYDEVVKETARLTDNRRELCDGALDQLNATLSYLRGHLDEHPKVTITYFQEDKRKSGGAYLTCTGIVSKIDEHGQIVVMQDRQTISFEDIVDAQISGSSF